MTFLKEMQGKSIGDRVFFATMTDSERRIYDISILDVSSGEAEELYDDGSKCVIEYADGSSICIKKLIMMRMAM